MKVEQSSETCFTPVIIILETQEEVDKLYTIFNHYIISTALGLEEWWEKLRPFCISKNVDKFHELLSKIIK